MSKKFFWIDLEMTGLDEKVDSILEVAIVITDLDLHPLEEYHQVVYQTPEVLQKMNEWCQKQHLTSGLIKAVPNGAPLEKVEACVMALVERHFSKNKQIVLCGNSIGNDRRFIEKYMPKLTERLHYRMIDVSSFKEVFRQKYSVEVKKTDSHRAVDDIHESIGELKTYLEYITVPP